MLLARAKEGDLPAVEDLLASGLVDPNARDAASGETALFYAVEQAARENDPSLLELLLSGEWAGRNEPLFLCGGGRGDAAAGRAGWGGKVQLDAPTGRSDPTWRLPLTLGGSTHPRPPPTRPADGADTNVHREDSLTPLIVAVTNADNSTTLSLLEAGADPNLNATDGTTPLFAAVVYAPQLVEVSVGKQQCGFFTHGDMNRASNTLPCLPLPPCLPTAPPGRGRGPQR